MTPPSIEVRRDRRDPAAVERLLRSLPDWFGIEESIQEYVADAASLPTYLAVDPGTDAVVGALVLKRTEGMASGEIHVLAVDPQRHRQGVGRALVAAAESDLRTDGAQFLHVKTLGPSHPDPGYAATRAFYLALGFLPIEELHDYWPGNPCLIMVKPLS